MFTIIGIIKTILKVVINEKRRLNMKKCKKCGGNVIDIIEKQLSIITPIGHNERPLGSVFVARCPNCCSESSRYFTEEEAETKGVAEVFE